MEHVIVRRVEVLGGYRLRVTFNDGLVGEVEVDPRDRGPMFEPLLVPEYFARVRVSRASGTVVWPNGLDLAPDALYERVVAAGRVHST